MEQKSKTKTFVTTIIFLGFITINANAQSAVAAKNKQTEVMSTSTEVTAKVKSIDYKTRKMTLTLDGESYNLVAGNDVINFDQIKKGDTVTAKYSEALVYNINRGGKAAPPTTSATATSARPGENPSANLERKVTASVIITEINRKEPSVTFKGASGETQTFKVMHPERLEGVKVGDAVEITYSEALAMKVEKKNK